MISMHGTTWTEKQETFELITRFKAKHGPEGYPMPRCLTCKAVTWYIVEPYTRSKSGRAIFKRPGVAFLLNTIHLNHGIGCGLIFDEDTMCAYIPSTSCIRCQARYEAITAFNAGQLDPDDPIDRSLTTEEILNYTEAFKDKIAELEEKRILRDRPHSRALAR